MTSASTNFYRQTRAARKIIVVDLGFLGDTVHLVPALWEIKRGYPEAALHVLTSTVGAEVLGLAPCVDRGWAVEMYPGKRTLRQQWQVIRALRGERFDVAFNFSGADRTIFMTALSGARWRVAHESGREHLWNSWLISNWVSRRSTELPVYEQRQQVLAQCGLTLAPARFDLRLPEEAQVWAAAHVPAGALHFSVNASTCLKEWPLDHWIELARRVLQEQPGRSIVATGNANEREATRLRRMATAVELPGLQTFTGLTVAQLAAVLARCSLHVGADSGVLHLAAALGVPTFSLFRNYPGLSEWAPRGPQHRCLTVDCPCVGQKHPACLATQRAACLGAITPEAVLSAVGTHVAS